MDILYGARAVTERRRVRMLWSYAPKMDGADNHPVTGSLAFWEKTVV